MTATETVSHGSRETAPGRRTSVLLPVPYVMYAVALATWPNTRDRLIAAHHATLRQDT